MAAALDYLNDIESVKKELAERKLTHFIRQAWPQVEPAYQYLHNWHIDVMSEYLEAVRHSQIQQLIINIPPRCMKSIECAVMFPAWCWTNTPSDKFVFASYAQNLSVRDSMKMRRLIKSDWYQSRWPMSLLGDSDNKMKFENEHTGYRIATSVGGVGTGEGGDYVFADDPHNVVEGESDAKREDVLLWWDESMSSRLNNPKTGRRVVIMQRVHQNDLVGHLLEQGGWVHLCLPMEFGLGPTVHDMKVVSPPSSIHTRDPRTREGELLWPERIGDAELTRLKTNMGTYAYAGQMNQNPTPRKGAMFDVDKIEMRTSPSAPIKRVVRCWDKAGTEGAGARTAGVKMALLENKRICIMDSKIGQWEAAKRNRIMKNTAVSDGKQVKIYIEQEGGSGGKESAENSVKELVGFYAYAEVPKGDKEWRAEPFVIQIDANNVEMLVGDWNEEYLNELRKFPNGTFKDQTDASALCVKKLTDRTNRVLS